MESKPHEDKYRLAAFAGIPVFTLPVPCPILWVDPIKPFTQVRRS